MHFIGGLRQRLVITFYDFKRSPNEFNLAHTHETVVTIALKKLLGQVKFINFALYLLVYLIA